ncbi:MAG: TIGR02587 family membrane protein [Chloroflexi bacterium]|nr:TIGR02587 family membrane protein [Chloroflexota bacterium]
MDRPQAGSWGNELNDLVRALSGAFLFGAPLLFTMEMWWIGLYAEGWKLLTLLALALAANLGLASTVGFHRGTTLAHAVDQAVDAMAMGVLAALAVLLTLHRLTFSDPLGAILGKVIIQAVPLSIGASVANAVFGNGRDDEGNGDGGSESPARATLHDLGSTAIGAVFIGFSIAPTDEVPLLVAGMSPLHILATVGLSLVVTYAIVHASGFDPYAAPSYSASLIRRPITETLTAYVVSLGLAFVMLYLLDRISLEDPLPHIVAQSVVLALPASIGGAAGRLAV